MEKVKLNFYSNLNLKHKILIKCNLTYKKTIYARSIIVVSQKSILKFDIFFAFENI